MIVFGASQRCSDVCPRQRRRVFSLDSMRHKKEHISISMLASPSIGAEVLWAKNQFDDDIRWNRAALSEGKKNVHHLRTPIAPTCLEARYRLS